MSAPDRIWAAPGKYGWADGLCGDRPSPGNSNDTAFLLETPARRHADELAEALQKIANYEPMFDYCGSDEFGLRMDRPGSPYDRGREHEANHLTSIARAALAKLEEKP